MSLPTISAAAAGLALVRQGPDSNWNFVCWIGGNEAIALQVLTAGTHRFEVWQIVGKESGVASATYDGPVRIGVIQMHK